ncbi:MAG: limonene-1,2-epoxide hydrolase family protein [Rhodococcus sp. (in: high G+C Gram-positive bacteria)]|uniref:limonene-1,2-epoxide hydrolase family protein n=1 Tax=Rhodococcus sp. TaxID=1831 RepID=UPI003BAF7573
MTNSSQIVREFCDLMVKRDTGVMRPFFADDAVYQNTGMPASVGIEAIIENLGGQFATFPDSYEYKTINIAADGDVVLTERLDLIRTPGGSVEGVPVMGTFVLRNGKIVRWTDYWDTSLPMKMMTGEDVSALIPSSY